MTVGDRTCRDRARERALTAAGGAALWLAAAGLVTVGQAPETALAQREQSTQLISRAAGGGLPNGPSTNAVISNDRRFARVIAFQSAASDLVAGDTNAVQDVFAVKRAGSFVNDGSPWRPGSTILVSRGRGGPANGPSFSPSVDGSFTTAASCVAFLSGASNLVTGDTNGKVDAFVSRGPGRAPARVSTPGGRQASSDTTDVAVNGDCSKIAFVTGGALYVRSGSRTSRIATRGAADDPSWSTGKAAESDLVFGASGGVYLSRGGTRRPALVGPGGRNPAFNNIKRQVVAYEKRIGGRVQVVWRDLGQRERLASALRSTAGDADSRDPVIGNSGFYIAFQSDAGNLQTDAAGRRSDDNGAPDVYLYTDVRDITLLQSVEEKGRALPGGGMRPSMSFYANYIVFDSPGPLGSGGSPQVYMRYLGPV